MKAEDDFQNAYECAYTCTHSDKIAYTAFGKRSKEPRTRLLLSTLTVLSISLTADIAPTNRGRLGTAAPPEQKCAQRARSAALRLLQRQSAPPRRCYL